MKVTDIKTQDIRFPTSKENLGTDAVHVDCDYSATYVTIITEDKHLDGIGLTFTIGKGNNLCCEAIKYFKEFILNKDVEDIELHIYDRIYQVVVCGDSRTLNLFHSNFECVK